MYLDREDEEGPSGEGSRGFAPIQRFTTNSGRIEIISTGMPMQVRIHLAGLRPDHYLMRCCATTQSEIKQDVEIW